MSAYLISRRNPGVIFALASGATRAIFAGANFTSAVWVSAIFFDFNWSNLAL